MSFRPQLLLVSAGFDAHEADPLASMRMTAAGYARIIQRLRRASGEGAFALVTEGGYDLPALRECIEAAIAATQADVAPVASDGPAPRGQRALETVRAAQSAFWRGL